jgi:hypothetical protein
MRRHRKRVLAVTGVAAITVTVTALFVVPALATPPNKVVTTTLADDPTCSPQVVQAGQGFLDNGHDTHVVRNEGSVDLVTVVVSLVPAGFGRRIDEPAPANCPALPNG